jgi:hypothetical protein
MMVRRRESRSSCSKGLRRTSLCSSIATMIEALTTTIQPQVESDSGSTGKTYCVGGR